MPIRGLARRKHQAIVMKWRASSLSINPLAAQAAHIPLAVLPCAPLSALAQEPDFLLVARTPAS